MIAHRLAPIALAAAMFILPSGVSAEPDGSLKQLVIKERIFRGMTTTVIRTLDCESTIRSYMNDGDEIGRTTAREMATNFETSSRAEWHCFGAHGDFVSGGIAWSIPFQDGEPCVNVPAYSHTELSDSCTTDNFVVRVRFGRRIEHVVSEER